MGVCYIGPQFLVKYPLTSCPYVYFSLKESANVWETEFNWLCNDAHGRKCKTSYSAGRRKVCNVKLDEKFQIGDLRRGKLALQNLLEVPARRFNPICLQNKRDPLKIRNGMISDGTRKEVADGRMELLSPSNRETKSITSRTGWWRYISHRTSSVTGCFRTLLSGLFKCFRPKWAAKPIRLDGYIAIMGLF